MLTPTDRPRREFNQGRPEFDRSRLPKDEHTPAWELQSAMDSAARSIRAFDDAVALFEYCNAHIAAAYQTVRASKIPGKSLQHERIAGYATAWGHMAARDAPINLWNFSQMLDKIRSIANRCPTIKGAADWREMEAAKQDFHAAFPTAKKSRHSAAHGADIRNTPERNAVKGELKSGGIISSGGSMLVTDTISGNKAVGTVDGKLVECEVSSATVETMHKTLQRIFAAFNAPTITAPRR